MNNTDNKTVITEVHNPLEIGKKTIDEIFDDCGKQLTALTFISTYSIKNKSDEYLLPKSNKFLYHKWNRIYMVEIKKGKIVFSLKANFVVTDVKECTLIYNDKSGKPSQKYYLVTLKNANGKIEKDVEIANNSKSDYKQFQSDMNSRYNDFAVNMTESEFKTFVAEYISPKIANNALIYTNAGILKEGQILYKNALATKDGIIWTDENGYIKTGENTYIKIAESTHYLPELAKSIKTGKEIAKDLLTNIIECWSDDIVLPMITLGHFVMSIYYEEFVKKYGVPTLILFGETGTGKSTLVTVGLSIFGLSRDALTSGGSTAKSNEYFSSKYNGMTICIDDVKGQTLNSANFTALVKGAYKAIPRTRMLPYGRGVEYIHICSPMAYSTNDTLPDLKEVINRLSIVEIFGKVFKADKFKYHEVDKGNNNNLKELSLILPEFLKYSIKDVLEVYETVFSMLENSKIQDTQKRVINNLAYAYTGIMLLLDISGIQIDDLDEKIIDYARRQVQNYENIKTPVEKVLAAIIVLTKLGQLESGTHFKIVDVEVCGRMETHIRFNKELMLSAINKFYAYDKSMKIDESNFLSYAKNHQRFRGNGHGVRYADDKNKVVNSICFDISGISDFSDISNSGVIMPPSAEDLKRSLEQQKGNQM